MWYIHSKIADVLHLYVIDLLQIIIRQEEISVPREGCLLKNTNSPYGHVCLVFLTVQKPFNIC